MPQRLTPTKDDDGYDDDDTWHSAVVSHAQKGKSINPYPANVENMVSS